MQAWRIAKRAYALDLNGTGARLTGGRWNSPGVAAIYAGMTAEIAAMEKLVHSADLIPKDLVLAAIRLPDDAKLYARFGVKDLPDGWDALPSSASAISTCAAKTRGRGATRRPDRKSRFLRAP